ncbi:MAG: hypothetical protein KKA60_07025 [Proteobacteria bacterium]|nr:hypothetical protein [Pseudomonadota bacterium]
MAPKKRFQPDPIHPLDPAPDFEGGKGKGVRLKDMSPYNDWVLARLVDKAEVFNPEALLSSDGRPVVVITSHGPGVAWMPALALVSRYYIENGLGNLVGGMYPHPAVFWVPGLKSYYEEVLGTPTAVNTVDGVVESLKSGDIHLTGTAPEGANCLFSFDEYVAPFRSRGMIAAAIKADAHVCLLAHLGAEAWTISINLPFGWKLPNTNGLRGINITLPPYKKLPHYLVNCRTFTPSMTGEEMARMTKRKARLYLNVEVERMRTEMNIMTDELKAAMAARKNPRTLRVV